MKVSIFMFCKNSAATIRRALESVLSQGYPDLELIVQDGQSTDGTLEILEEYADRIELRSEEDSCPGEAFFRALSRCTGDIVGSCLSDEELLPGSIVDAVAAFSENSDIVAVTRDALLTDREGSVVGKFIGRPFRLREYIEAE